jgi:Coenzyme PQQ synthesis protein D (PqqD)
MTIDGEALLHSRLRLPQHVVHRSFVAETVVLNLKTGMYHGLNATAGRMLEALDGADTVAAAAATVASEYGEDPAIVQADLVELCRQLLDRRLVEVVGDHR